jgi:xylose isomerase
LEDGRLEAMRAERYAGWATNMGRSVREAGLEALSKMVLSQDIRPQPRSGRQERLENIVNSVIEGK